MHYASIDVLRNMSINDKYIYIYIYMCVLVSVFFPLYVSSNETRFFSYMLPFSLYKKYYNNLRDCTCYPNSLIPE